MPAEKDLESIGDGWLLRGGPNGGYLASMAMHAMARAVPGRSPLAATVQFLSRPKVGEVAVSLRTLRAGRTHSTVQAELSQEGSPRLLAVATFAERGTFDEDDTGEDRAGEDGAREGGASAGFQHRSMPAVPDPEESVPLPLDRLTGSFERRLDRRAPSAETVEFLQGVASGPAQVGGWTRFADGTPLGATTVPLMMDSWPPPPHRHFGFGGGVVSVDLTVHWRGRPGDGWHFVWFESTLLRHGYAEIDGLLWRPDGVLVAQSRQLARYTPPAG
ncbi:thioesterase family protein [Nonomuraea sp. CA-143628]|uniref:thioesterase family protein n=1 Tax=Nonomuraea sp. CA-143628 TaxID=3239997 RepID=UPI003D8C1EF3